MNPVGREPEAVSLPEDHARGAGLGGWQAVILDAETVSQAARGVHAQRLCRHAARGYGKLRPATLLATLRATIPWPDRLAVT